MISQYTLNNILLEFAISTSRPTAARLILQILAKYYSMYISKSFNNCIIFKSYKQLTSDENESSIVDKHSDARENTACNHLKAQVPLLQYTLCPN